jgi:hypothetical protein
MTLSERQHLVLAVCVEGRPVRLERMGDLDVGKVRRLRLVLVLDNKLCSCEFGDLVIAEQLANGAALPS